MTPERHARIKDLFLSVIEYPAERQNAVLDRLCGDDRELRNEVQRLLDRHDSHTITPDGTFPLETSRDQRFRSDAADPGSIGSASQGGEADGEHHLTSGHVVAGRYRIVALLGQGGMATVYRAEDLELHQTVALKFLAPQLVRSKEWLSRFRREVRTGRNVTHANVCRVYDIGEAEGHPFMSMEFVDGEDLASLLRRIGRLPREKAVAIASQICAGIGAAHAKGVLHRDLKPKNIMLDGRGNVRIADFGLAATAREIAGEKLRAGTPAYMAPEQFSGENVSEQSDIYALGLIIYELFTGRPVFEGRSIAEYAELHLNAVPVAPSDLVDGLDAATDGIILQCLAKDPRLRPAEAMLVATGLTGGDALAASLAAGETPSPELVAHAIRPLPAESRTNTLLFIAALVMLGALVATGGLTRTTEVMRFLAPEVLADRCRQRIAAIPGLTEGHHTAYGLCSADDCLEQMLAAAGHGSTQSPRLRTESTLLFWYRQSPTPFVVQNVGNVLLGSARVTIADPPPLDGGMVTAIVDGDGRLLALHVTPPPAGAARLVPTGEPWALLLDWAGVGGDDLVARQAEPGFPSYADERAAWRSLSTADDRTTADVLAAAVHGTPVFFALIDQPADGQRSFLSDPGRRAKLVQQSFQIISLTILAASAPLALRNLRLGRCDRSAAFRLATVVFIIRLSTWIISARHTRHLADELMLLIAALAAAISLATIAWILYAALEPMLRRNWPHCIVAWTRLARFRVWDRVVGRHMLIGGCVGVFWANLAWLDRALVAALGLPSRPPLILAEDLQPILYARDALASSLSFLVQSVMRGLLFSLLIIGLRRLTRRNAVASIVSCLLICLIYVPGGGHPAVSLVTIGLAGVLMAVWLIVRHGLLATVTALFISRILLTCPLSLSVGAWYADSASIALVTVLATLVFGFSAARTAPVPVRIHG